MEGGEGGGEGAFGRGSYPRLICVPYQYKQGIKYRQKARKNFRKDIAIAGFSLTEISALLHDNADDFQCISLVRDAVILDNIPRAAEKRKEKLHEQRLDVSRVMMRKGLPADLVPWICAFTVPGSKQYAYMNV